MGYLIGLLLVPVLAFLGWKYRSSIWSTFLKALIGSGVIAILVAVANYVPLLKTYPEQDECNFGPVSKEQYQRYLREAQSRQRMRWPSLNSDSQEIERQLNFRLADMLNANSSIYERMAIMHAILRAVRARYINTNGSADSDPYEVIKQRPQALQISYSIETNRLVWFQLYPRRILVIAALSDVQASRPETLEKYGRQQFIAHPVHFMDRPPSDWVVLSGQNCPPVPDADIASRYEARKP